MSHCFDNHNQQQKRIGHIWILMDNNLLRIFLSSSQQTRFSGHHLTVVNALAISNLSNCTISTQSNRLPTNLTIQMYLPPFNCTSSFSSSVDSFNSSGKCVSLGQTHSTHAVYLKLIDDFKIKYLNFISQSNETRQMVNGEPTKYFVRKWQNECRIIVLIYRTGH